MCLAVKTCQNAKSCIVSNKSYWKSTVVQRKKFRSSVTTLVVSAAPTFLSLYFCTNQKYKFIFTSTFYSVDENVLVSVTIQFKFPNLCIKVPYHQCRMCIYGILSHTNRWQSNVDVSLMPVASTLSRKVKWSPTTIMIAGKLNGRKNGPSEQSSHPHYKIRWVNGAIANFALTLMFTKQPSN